MMDNHLFGPADLKRARDEGVQHGRELASARTENVGKVLLFLGAALVIAAIVTVIIVTLNRPPRPGYEFVQVGGETCVQVVNPDFSSMNELPSPQNLLFCEDMR